MPALWHIYHVVNCRHSTPVKDKLVVIACFSVKYMGFLINSDINTFVKKRPQLLICEVAVKASDYQCLAHDSYVHCVDIYPFDDNELLNIRDPISDRTKLEIRRAVAASMTIERCYKKII